MMHDMEFTDTTELYNAYIKALGSRRDVLHLDFIGFSMV
jgi:hypothetical protein